MDKMDKISQYVVLTVNGITPSHEGCFPRNDDGEFFPAVYDIRVINDPDVELRNQLDTLISCRQKGVIGTFEVYNYDQSNQNAGWIIDTYDGEYRPLYKVKCVRV